MTKIAGMSVQEWVDRTEKEMADRRRLPPHLDWVELHEFSENVPREHGEERSGRCQAWPAKAFQPKYPDGCLRHLGHLGPHSAIEATARRMDEKDARRANAG